MKNPNHKLCFFVLLILALSCSKDGSDFLVSQESNNIDTIVNAKLIYIENNQEVEVTTNYIKDKWENALRKEGFEVKLNKFEILEGFNKKNGEKIYFLKTISEDGTLETGAFINKTDKIGVYSLSSKTCTCTGCPTGCNLVISGDNCSCSSCPGPNKSCTKTETGGTGDL